MYRAKIIVTLSIIFIFALFGIIVETYGNIQ